MEEKCYKGKQADMSPRFDKRALISAKFQRDHPQRGCQKEVG